MRPAQPGLPTAAPYQAKAGKSVFYGVLPALSGKTIGLRHIESRGIIDVNVTRYMRPRGPLHILFSVTSFNFSVACPTVFAARPAPIICQLLQKSLGPGVHFC